MGGQVQALILLSSVTPITSTPYLSLTRWPNHTGLDIFQVSSNSKLTLYLLNSILRATLSALLMWTSTRQGIDQKRPAFIHFPLAFVWSASPSAGSTPAAGIQLGASS